MTGPAGMASKAGRCRSMAPGLIGQPSWPLQAGMAMVAGEHPLQSTNQLYVKDINDGQFRRKGTDAWKGRETNPLMPRYVYDVEHRERWPTSAKEAAEGGAAQAAPTTVIGPIPKSFPRPNRTLRVDPEYNLMTSDIDGATPGW